MARPRILCIDVMGSVFTARLVLDAHEETVRYTMTCTGEVQNGPYEMAIEYDPCNDEHPQQWTCEVLRVREKIVEYRLVGGGHGGGGEETAEKGSEWVGSIPEGPCGIEAPVECPPE